MRRLFFPVILSPLFSSQVEQYEGQEVRECYVFKHPTDQFCPVILHFCLVNNKFREFKAPGKCSQVHTSPSSTTLHHPLTTQCISCSHVFTVEKWTL